MDQDLTRQLEELTAAMREVVRAQNEARATGDGARKAETMDASADLAKTMSAVSQARQDASVDADRKSRNDEINDIVQEAVKAALRGTRAPSMAEIVGSGTTPAVRDAAARHISLHPALKASLGEAEPGSILSAIMGAKSNDYEWQTASKATLSRYGIGYAENPAGKAVLGTTNAGGGYVLPNNLVDTLVKPNPQGVVWQLLVTTINGVSVRGVDQPYRLGTPAAMTFQPWGNTKTNVGETYGSYTANLGTLAAVIDISKQYARFSAGAAERDVIDELTKAAILGENASISAGAGTVNTGTGDPTIGIYTALNAATTFTNENKAFSSASNSTVAGSFANALAQAQLQLAARARRAEAFVVDATTFWTAIGQGSDTAGFWVAPSEGVTGFQRTQSGGLTYWGVPVYYDINLGTNATTKIAIGGEFSVAKLYRGMEFRIDSTDVAGTRWDQNLIGFRGEEEIGFNAYTAVNVGALQLMTAVIP